MAQGTYVVSSQLVQARTYPNKHGGNLTVWRLGLQGVQSTAPDGLFELHKKEGNDPPGVGEQLEVERTQEGEFQGETFGRIFLAYKQDGAPQGGQSRGGGDSKNFDRRPEHPRNEARMIHTSSLSAAPKFIEQMLTVGVAAQPKDEAAYWALVGHVAGKLTKSYEAPLSGTEAAPAASPQPQLNGGEVPADTEGLQPAAAPGTTDGEDIPF